MLSVFLNTYFTMRNRFNVIRYKKSDSPIKYWCFLILNFIFDYVFMIKNCFFVKTNQASMRIRLIEKISMGKECYTPERFAYNFIEKRKLVFIPDRTIIKQNSWCPALFLIE